MINNSINHNEIAFLVWEY